MSLDDWHQYLKYITSDKFVNLSSKNKADKAKLPYSSNHGTRSYAASCYVEAMEEDWCIPRPSGAVPRKAYVGGTVGQLEPDDHNTREPRRTRDHEEIIVMIDTIAGYVSTAGEVQRKYSKSLLLLEGFLLLEFS
ncbi:hypothetical protein Tco_1413943 [Tanacetum coccineum]